MTSAPAVSVIVPTYRRFADMINTVCDLLDQSYRPMEIIVVDQNDEWPMEYRDRIEELSRHPTLIWLREKQRGPVWARHAGVQKSRGEILLFIDDDVEIEDRDFVKRHVRSMRENGADAIAGREVPPRPSCGVVAARGGMHAKDSTSEVLSPFMFDRNSTERAEVCTFSTCNGSVRRGAFLRVGGFDENFCGASYGDDYDFAMRLSAAGGKIVYDPTCALVHLRSPLGGLRLSDLDNRSRETDIARAVLVYFFRYADRRSWRYLLWHHVFRKTIVRRRNMHSLPRLIRSAGALVWCVPSGWRLARRGAVSRFAAR